MTDIVKTLRDQAASESVLPDHWMMKAAADEIERLRALLHDAPILIIDKRAAALLGEKEAIAYATAVEAWHSKAKVAVHNQ